MKLLIAEDDLSVCDMLRLFFAKEGYTAVFLHDGIQAELAAEREHWDLIILDWMIPGVDGLTLCRTIRARRNTPIILLTAKVSEQDRIQGLETGADDYVTKPFSPGELLARIKAVMRRYHSGRSTDMQPEGDPQEEDGVIRYRDMVINPSSRLVTVAGRRIFGLTPKEFELFTLFVKYPKRVFTREQLLESVWGFDYFGEERTVDVHIKRLRNKVSTPDLPLIATVWGVGYKLEE